MAKITVNVDTEQKTLEVLINGELQDNVNEANFYFYEGYDRGDMELSSRITLRERDENTGITKITYLMAKQSKDGKEALASGASINKHIGLVESIHLDKVKQDIADYFCHQ